jgi:hypothetical protein
VTEVEIDRVLNAVSATLNDQRPANPSVSRLQEIVDGATGQERVFHVRAVAAARFELHAAQDGALVAMVQRDGADSWTVGR